MAGAPLVGLRFHMDCRAADLEDLASDLERQLIEIGARRANLLVRLRRVEDARQAALEVLPALSSRPPALLADITATFAEDLDVSTEITRFEARAAGIRARLGQIADEQAVLRKMSRELAQVPGQSTVEPDQRASRYSQAARQIYEIADIEHAETARLILEGPMQRLWDAALEAELIGRSMAREPATAVGASARCRTAAADASDQLGEVIAGLLPLNPDRGLVGAIRELTAGWAERGTILLHLLGSERRMPQLAEIAMYRILEQAIDNALTHGRPQRVDAIISFLPQMVVAVVKDDGDGFDVGATDARLGRTDGLGMIEMRERAALVGGRVQVRSGLGLGTEVRVTVPDGRATT
ncbi:MAG TPA: ATP-binding protein [Candidatus Saccharimonadales bacterium]|nr:ATP-binding protein [Candidatus Saccharimonadales bacterium]